MGLKDLIITPVYLVLLTLLAIYLRPFLTNVRTRKFFLPALWVRFAGAIALGLVYQFYYDGGDTFNYWEHGSRWIWQAFNEDIWTGFKLMLTSGGDRMLDDTYEYSTKIWYYRDSRSYLIVRIAAFLDLFTFHTYSATALFFAFFSFSGQWMIFKVIEERYGLGKRKMLVWILFIPSVIFWGSGILKDTITLGAFGWLVYALFQMIEKKMGVENSIVAGLSSYLIFAIKPYILMCLLPAVTVWIFFKFQLKIRGVATRFLILPFLLLFFFLIGFYAIDYVGEINQTYQLDSIAQKARVTAYDIRYGWGARSGGDGGYDLGELDGTWQSMVRLAPQAINVSLFRPYLWEVRNPLMLLSSLESTLILFFCIFSILKRKWRGISKDPFLLFCLFFTILFAFAVGISTYNFGTLIRYKLSLMPLFLTLLLNRNLNRN